MIAITGSLNSHASTTYNLDFSNDHINRLGYGEGKNFLGTASVTDKRDRRREFQRQLPERWPARRTLPRRRPIPISATLPNFPLRSASCSIIPSTRLRVLTGDNVLHRRFHRSRS